MGLLAEVFLGKEKGATIIHDPRVIWNTIDVVTNFGGKAVVSKTGHAFVKAAMRKLMRFTAAKCRRITTSGILPIATAGSFHGYWSGNTFSTSNPHYRN